MTNAFSRTSLCASALALSVAGTAVWADTHGTAATGTTANSMAGMEGQLIRTRDITGGDIYTLNAADDEGWDSAEGYSEVGADWNDIGEIEDIVLDRSGKLVGIVGEIGGFLDIADKHVMIPVENVRLVPVDDRSYSYVTRMSEEELEALPDVDEGFWD
ncbi:MAG: PRC-barrel domain-containing protein [Rhodobacterales bacterium]|nr:PRC-barrel domain-containing protein [Rhodobacterales bacterium]MDX5414299.1 PRC-barrel domain-containing protein [Rhodobacterales bacterium]